MKIRAHRLNFTSHSDPYEWFCADRFFSTNVFRRLQGEFPHTGYCHSFREEGDGKHYCTWDLLVIDNDIPIIGAWDNLSPAWRSVLNMALSNDYRNYLAALTNRDLAGTSLHARFTIYNADCWLAPHLDRADKVITQTVYFPGGPIDGGELLILGSSSADDVKAVVAPTPNRSVILLPSYSSWHCVCKVAASTQHERRALLLHYVRPVKQSEPAHV